MKRGGKKLGTRKQGARVADAKNAYRHLDAEHRREFLRWMAEGDHGAAAGFGKYLNEAIEAVGSEAYTDSIE